MPLQFPLMYIPLDAFGMEMTPACLVCYYEVMHVIVKVFINWTNQKIDFFAIVHMHQTDRYFGKRQMREKFFALLESLWPRQS